MTTTAEFLDARARTPLQRLLVLVLSGPTSLSSAGYPYLAAAAYAQLLHRVPQTLQLGTRVWDGLDTLTADLEGLDPGSQHHLAQSKRVVQQVLRTAAITAPPTLWLTRHVLGALCELGVSARLLDGQTLNPSETDLDPVELDTDLSFLTVLGLLEREAGCFRLAPGPEPRRALSELPAPGSAAGTASIWATAARGQPVDPMARATLLQELDSISARTHLAQDDWCPQLEEIQVGAVLLPLIVGLASTGRCHALRADPGIPVVPEDPELATAGRHILTLAGVLLPAERTEAPTLHLLGHRLLDRGPGPFGIVEAYHPYMDQAAAVLRDGRGPAHVERSGNIAASQRANRDSFRRANDALDQFCRDTGFRYAVFIEHALGRGEATRQRFVRSGDARIRYVGADLEDAAIDAAEVERKAGVLPLDMCFVRGADIGRPDILLDAMAAAGISSRGAVMMVGNGFHEIREASDERLSAVFRAYCEAGIVLMFTEETALSITDQRATGWNTYHPAFRYVHEKSGQGLRPALSRPTGPSDPLPTSWSSLAEQGGYRRVDAYCSPGRTIYPCPPAGGHNPSTTMNYFFLPPAIFEALG